MNDEPDEEERQYEARERAVAVVKDANAVAIEQALVQGNLAGLTPPQRIAYYNRVCDSLGLNPLTKPFEYVTLNGKLQLYARKDCTDQLRKRDGVSIRITARELVDGVYVVTASASDSTGRTDESIGAVPLANLQGEVKANAMMKCETKAKRRVTLSFCGLGIVDESEVDAIPGARVVALEDAHGEDDGTITEFEAEELEQMILRFTTGMKNAPKWTHEWLRWVLNSEREPPYTVADVKAVPRERYKEAHADLEKKLARKAGA